MPTAVTKNWCMGRSQRTRVLHLYRWNKAGVAVTNTDGEQANSPSHRKTGADKAVGTGRDEDGALRGNRQFKPLTYYGMLCPKEIMKIITREFIFENSSSNTRAGWTRSQLNAIGVEWPPKAGWIKRVIGKQISEEQEKIFVAGRYAPQLTFESEDITLL